MKEIIVDTALALVLLATTLILSFLLAVVLVGWEFAAWFAGLPDIGFWIFWVLLILIVLTLFITNL